MSTLWSVALIHATTHDCALPQITAALRKPIFNANLDDINNYRCCMSRQNCSDRSDWPFLNAPTVRFANMYGFHVALGHTNFHTERFRACELSPKEYGALSACP